MSKGVTLIEFMIGILLGSLIVLSVSSIYVAVKWTYSSQRSGWLCMQSLRTAVLMLNRDIEECAYLLPRDMKASYCGNKLFIAGLPASSEHEGLILHASYTPPYFSVVKSRYGDSIIVDTLDIDSDGKPDYKAGYGVVSDSGAYEIMYNYSKGKMPLPLKGGAPDPGERIVPAVVYQLKEDGLFRNNQLISENVTEFSAARSGNELSISMRATKNGTSKKISYSYNLGE